MFILFLSRQVLSRVSKEGHWFLLPSMFALLLLFWGAPSASAHPLGNFTINHYARIEIASTQAQLYLVFDFAEIPTFQEKQMIDINGDGNLTDAERVPYLAALLEKLKANLTLDIGGKPAALSLVPNSAQLEFLPGQGGLEIMQIRARFTAPLELNAAPITLRYRDDNYPERLGWREIVAKPAQSVTLTKSNVRATETSDELRAYPEDLLTNPLNDREANLTVTRGAQGTTESGNSEASNTNSFVILALVVGVVVAVGLVSAFLILRRR